MATGTGGEPGRNGIKKIYCLVFNAQHVNIFVANVEMYK